MPLVTSVRTRGVPQRGALCPPFCPLGGSPARSALLPVRRLLVSTAAQWNRARGLLLLSPASWEPPDWQRAHAGIHSGDSAVHLEAKGPAHRGRLRRSAPLCLGGRARSDRGVPTRAARFPQTGARTYVTTRNGSPTFFSSPQYFRTQGRIAIYSPNPSN